MRLNLEFYTGKGKQQRWITFSNILIHVLDFYFHSPLAYIKHFLKKVLHYLLFSPMVQRGSATDD